MPRLSGPVDLAKRSWALFKQQWKTLVLIAVIPTAITLVFSLAFAGLLAAFPGQLEALLAGAGTVAGNIGLIALAVLLILVFVVISTLATLALVYAVKDQSDFKSSFRLAWQNILGFWWVSLVAIAILIPAFIALIIPGIILGTYYSFSSFIYVDENARGYAALKRSLWYVRDYWWPVFGRIVAMVVAAMAVSLIPQLIFGLVNLPEAANLINTLVDLVVGPLQLIYFWLIYQELKKVKGQPPVAVVEVQN